MLEWGNLLLAEGGEDRHRNVEEGIQHREAALRAGLQAPGARGL